MTGYATAASGGAAAGGESSPGGASATSAATSAANPAAGAVTVEARSVNGRFLDLGFRMPDELRGLEPALRELLGAAFRRGKIELRISSQHASDDSFPHPSSEQVNRLMRLEGTVQGWLPQARGLSVNEVLHWCKGSAPAQRLDEPALDAARRCIAGLREARAREGARLATMLQERVAHLRTLALQAEPLVPAVVQRQQARFLERWAEAVNTAQGGAQGGSTGHAPPVPAQALQERAMAEAAAYAIRIDVAEELTRLRSHLDEIERLLKAGGELGKRLDFLIQELQREANTLGSKAAAIELTSIAVDMKVAIEQMREQVQNLE
jgi:uncharacterized protein YicC (UPF0701 family)